MTERPLTTINQAGEDSTPVFDVEEPTDGQTLVYDATDDVWKNGAGGGGGALLVNINDEGTMDKTWQEIYDAMPGAWAFGMGEYMPIYVITSSPGYKLSIRVLSSNTKYDFVADTANSYPTFDDTPG